MRFNLLFFVLLAAVAGGTISVVGAAEGAGPSAAIELGKAEPVTVLGNDDVVLHQKAIETDGDGITVTGNGDVNVTESRIVAKNYGVQVTGNGDVYLTKTHLKGERAAVMLTGNGTVHAKDCIIDGKIIVVGNGTFQDGGGNTMSGEGQAAPATSSASSDAVVSLGTGSVTVSGGTGQVSVNPDGSLNVSSGSGVDVTVEDGQVNVDTGGVAVDIGTDGE